MSKNVAEYFDKGISPQQFIEGMTKNQDTFISWQEQFNWENEGKEEFFQSISFRDDLRCMILMAEWCGDVIRNIPVVFKALEPTLMPVEVMIIEQFPELMDQFLTGGGRAVPIVIIADTGGHVLAQWGPRPKHVQEVMTKFKQENPDREAPDYNDKIQVARQEMGRQYGEGTGYQDVIVQELRGLLAAL